MKGQFTLALTVMRHAEDTNCFISPWNAAPKAHLPAATDAKWEKERYRRTERERDASEIKLSQQEMS